MEGLKGIDIRTNEQVKYVSKPWGWEKWLAHGKPDFPYAFQMIHVTAPNKTSLQFHEAKQESNFLLSGEAILYYSTGPIDAERFKTGNYTRNELENIINNLKTHEFKAGEIVHVLPCYIHRIQAVSDITLMETSTTELDDVFRLQDDANRIHGKIQSEHQVR